MNPTHTQLLKGRDVEETNRKKRRIGKARDIRLLCVTAYPPVK
jgi:hypothetical protein